MVSIGVPKEVKNHEYRVGLTPQSVAELTAQGHQVFVQTQAGAKINFTDADYQNVGAWILDDAPSVFESASLIVKVKEPQALERTYLKDHHTLFTYLHLAPDLEQTADLLASKATCIAYETVTDQQKKLPLLTPMSAVAGRLSVQAGAHCLENYHGGRGVLLGGVPGVTPGKVIILGGGIVGFNATSMAVGLGADVCVLDKNLEVLRQFNALFGNSVTTLYSTPAILKEHICTADLVIGGVLVPGATAPKLITKDMIQTMKPGSVLVDVAIDQGGCAETSKPTTHQNPTYVVDNVIHYCVTNMPGAVARTSTLALNNATLPFVLALANKGTKKALQEDAHLRAGLNISAGKLTIEEVALAQNRPFISAQEALNAM